MWNQNTEDRDDAVLKPPVMIKDTLSEFYDINTFANIENFHLLFKGFMRHEAV